MSTEEGIKAYNKTLGRPRGVTSGEDNLPVHLLLLPELERSPRGVSGYDMCYVCSFVRTDRVAGGCQLNTGSN